jgi:hypothetical protein
MEMEFKVEKRSGTAWAISLPGEGGSPETAVELGLRAERGGREADWVGAGEENDSLILASPPLKAELSLAGEDGAIRFRLLLTASAPTSINFLQLVLDFLPGHP